MKRIHHSEKIPRFHRIAYYDFLRDEAVCAIIGWHLIVRLVYRVWAWSFRYNYTGYEHTLSIYRTALKHIARLKVEAVERCKDERHNRDACVQRFLGEASFIAERALRHEISKVVK